MHISTHDASKAPFPWDDAVTCDVSGAIWRARSNGRNIEPRRIDLPDRSKGYRNVVLPVAGKWRTFKAHRVVWLFFKGAIPDGMQINHINGDRSDNRIANLELATASQNVRHSYDELARARPWTYTTEWRGRPRVSAEDVRAIRALHDNGHLLKEIAAKRGLSVTHVHRILTERRWIGASN